MAGNIYTRQNDKLALIFRRASYLCYKKERRLKYLVMVMSTILCLLSILNRYSSTLFWRFPDIVDSSEAISSGLIMLSGILLIMQMFISCVTKRLHKEGVNFEERFDNYVFNMTPNRTLMRPISDANIENYASKIHKPNDFFRDYYFDEPAEALEKGAQFNNYARIFEDNYRLMLNTKGFFQTIWVGFAIIIVLLAASFNDTFVRTLVNVMIPSLSIISLIVNSWYSFGEQMRVLQNCINVTKEMTPANVNSEGLRALQDSLFALRLKSFEIPDFLIRSYEKRMARFSWETESKFFSGKGSRRATKPVAKERALAVIRPNETIKTIEKAANAQRVKRDHKLYRLSDGAAGEPIIDTKKQDAANKTPAKNAAAAKKDSASKKESASKKDADKKSPTKNEKSGKDSEKKPARTTRKKSAVDDVKTHIIP